MYGDQPGSYNVNEVMEEVCVGDAIHGGVDGEEEEEDIGNVPEAAQRMSALELWDSAKKLKFIKTYFDVTLGIIFPPVRVSTRSMNGIIDKTL